MDQTPIEKRPFPFTIATLCLLIGAVGSGVYLYSGDREQIYRNAEDIAELKVSAKECEEDYQSARLESTEIKRDVKHIKEAVDELREHFIKWE